MKSIDADKLIAEIERRYHKAVDESKYMNSAKFVRNELENLREFAYSLKQEQPEVDVNLCAPTNVDLSEEIENFCLEYDARKEAWYNMLPKDQKLIYNPTWQNFATNLAYHFYNRGYNAIKEK